MCRRRGKAEEPKVLLLVWMADKETFQNPGQSTLRHQVVQNNKAGCGILPKCISMKIVWFLKQKLFIVCFLKSQSLLCNAAADET